MKKSILKSGWTVYEITSAELTTIGGLGICDYCGKTHTDGYLIAVLNAYYCAKCFNEWDATAKYYPEDKWVENKNIEYYESKIPSTELETE